MNKLQEIAASTVERVSAARKALPLSQMMEKVASSRRPHAVLPAFAADGIHIIAEIKKASPSRGAIARDANPLHIAKAYLDAGARAISVLTEPKYFGGDIAFLTEIRKAHPQSLLLMKEFVVDEYQLVQARLAGADVVLLIVSLLGEEKLMEYAAKAELLGLTYLVEVHDEKELAVAIRAGSKFIGVNNRNLKTLEITVETSIQLASQIPNGTIGISESGLKTGEQLRQLRSLGYQGFLVGTSLMETPDPGASLKKLIGAAV